MPDPNPALLNRPLHKRILREKWAFTTPLDYLPGTKHGQRTEITVADKKGQRWIEEDSSRFNFIDNGGDILIVAHTDSVTDHPRVDADKHAIASPVLDNRIGVWLALCELPRYGIKADILLTEGEETGQSTAFFFRTEKKYNWIAEFDRMGFDCALYQYMDADTCEMVAKAGYTPVHGSFTDICDLGHLGVKAFNFGVCYRDYHSERAHIITAELHVAIQMFLYFYDMYKDTVMPHDNTAKKYYGKYSKWYSGSWRDWDDWDDATLPKVVRGSNWVSAEAPEGQFFAGQDKDGYLDDGQTPENWTDIIVTKGNDEYSLEDIAKYGDRAKPKTQAKAKASTTLSRWQKWDAWRDAQNTTRELVTFIECDICQRNFHPSQVIWDARNEVFMCDECDEYINGPKAAYEPEAAYCDFCGMSTEKVTNCTINGEKLALCDHCIGDLSHTGHNIQR